MRLTRIVAALFGLLLVTSANAGHATGKVGQVVVGRMGNQVFIELQASTFSDWPCATTHPDGFRYAFLITHAMGREMLAAVLTAQASGQDLMVIGTGSCSLDASLENVDYVVLRP